MLQEFRLSVPGRYENLALIGEFITVTARRAHLDDKAFNKQLSLRPSFYYDSAMGATVAGVYLKYDLNY